MADQTRQHEHTRYMPTHETTMYVVHPGGGCRPLVVTLSTRVQERLADHDPHLWETLIRMIHDHTANHSH